MSRFVHWPDREIFRAEIDVCYVVVQTRFAPGETFGP
jgi:hypothetical protein